MKSTASFQSPFLFNPEMTVASHWPVSPQVKPRRRALSLAMETQIDYKQEFICGVILMLCLLFGLSAVVAQFVLA